MSGGSLSPADGGTVLDPDDVVKRKAIVALRLVTALFEADEDQHAIAKKSGDIAVIDVIVFAIHQVNAKGRERLPRQNCTNLFL
jgi:uncharacterized protein (UPF0212 family)